MELKLKDRKKNTHHHDHDHHHHNHNQNGTMSTGEKLKTLCEHWIKHNESHGGTYSDWADKAIAEGLIDSARILNEIADMTADITKKMEDLAKTLEK